jgi:hypothetical protein
VKLTNAQQRDRWIAYVQAMPLPVEASCAPWKPTRSNTQNNLLFGVMYPPIAAHTGYEVGGDGNGGGIHEWMCGTFFGWVEKRVPKTPTNPEGVESVPFRTTTRGPDGKRDVMKAADFAKFLDHVERMAAKAGVFVSREMAA